MEIKEFREKVRPGKTIIIEGKKYNILQVVKFRLDDGSFYFKCFLSENRVIAEDSEMNLYIFVQPVKTDFVEPFPKKLNFDNKEFKFLYDAHAVAEKVWGKQNQLESERFWDYQAEDGSYLSLGISDKTNRKVDFYGKIVKSGLVNLK